MSVSADSLTISLRLSYWQCKISKESFGFNSNILSKQGFEEFYTQRLKEGNIVTESLWTKGLGPIGWGSLGLGSLGWASIG